MRLFLPLFVVLVAGPSVTYAQAPPEARDLLRAWQETLQAQRGTTLCFEVQANRRVEGPRGAIAIRTTADGTWTVSDRFVRLTLRSAERNGEQLTAERYEADAGLMRDRFGPQMGWIQGVPLVPLHELAAGRATDGVTFDERNGQRLWKVTVRDINPWIDEATLWFEPDRTLRSPRLAVSEVVQHREGEERRSRIAVTTTYRRVDGVEVPERLRSEGVFQAQHRLKAFTILYNANLTFTGVRTCR